MIVKNIKQYLQLNKSHIAIIGAGASGLLTSIILGRAGFKVTIFEKNKKIGRKILVTGNGRCNISNENIDLSNFYSTDINFIDYTLKQFTYSKFKQFFQDLGLELITHKDGKVYPQTLQASSVVDILWFEASQFGINCLLDTNVEKIQFRQNKFIITSNNDTQQQFDKVIVASGSRAMVKLGSSDAGYKFAQGFGHSIIKPFASLVQLESNNNQIQALAGVKIDTKVELIIDKEYIQSAVGDVLFTNYGLSGNAILDISREVSYALNLEKVVTVKIDIFPQFSKDILISKLTKRLKNSNEKDKYFWLEGFVHQKLIRYIVDNCGIKKQIENASELNKKDVMKLVYFMKNINIDIESTKGFDSAEVSAGGINISEIKSKTMESKLQKGLYFVGEVLDVDGACGGYNLHWAWASGYVCANGIILHEIN